LPGLDSNQEISLPPTGQSGCLVLVIKTLVKLLAFVNCCYCQNVMVGNDYTDKLIRTARE